MTKNSSIYGNEDHLLTQYLNDEYFNPQDEEYPALQAYIASDVDESKSTRRKQSKKRGNETQSVTIEEEVTDSQMSKKKQTAKKSDNITLVITDKDNGKIFNLLPDNSSKNKKKAGQTQSITIEEEVTDSQVSKKKQTAKKSDNITLVITDKDNGKIFNLLPDNSSKNIKKEESGSKTKKDTNTNVPLPSEQDKTTINSNTPSDDSLIPSSLFSDIVRLSVYGNQKCMINKKGALNCWWFKEESGWTV